MALRIVTWVVCVGVLAFGIISFYKIMKNEKK